MTDKFGAREFREKMCRRLGALPRCIKRHAHPFHKLGIDCAYGGPFNRVIAHHAGGWFDEANIYGR